MSASSQHPLLLRFVRYGSVSAISTVISLIILGVLVGPIGFPAIGANVIATTVATMPSFELNRRWVWTQQGRRSILRQATPYFILSFAGLVISTVAVHVASDATLSSTPPAHTAAVELANVGAYGALWIVQFVLCDRVLFPAPADAPNARGESNPQDDAAPVPGDDTANLIGLLTGPQSSPDWETPGAT